MKISPSNKISRSRTWIMGKTMCSKRQQTRRKIKITYTTLSSKKPEQIKRMTIELVSELISELVFMYQRIE